MKATVPNVIQMHRTRFFHLSPFCIAKLLHVASLALIFILFKYVNSTYTRRRVSPSFQQKPISEKIDWSVCILKKKLREHIFFEPYSASIKFRLGSRFKFDRVRLVHTLFKFFYWSAFQFHSDRLKHYALRRSCRGKSYSHFMSWKVWKRQKRDANVALREKDGSFLSFRSISIAK